MQRRVSNMAAGASWRAIIKARRLAFGVIATAILSFAPPHAHASGNQEIVWAMSGSGDGQLFRIDLTSNTFSLVGLIKDPVLGDVGSGWSTVADTPDGTLFFLRRFVSEVHVFSLDSNNILVSSG